MEKQLWDVAMVRLITEEDIPVTHAFSTATEAKIDPKVSSGQEKVGRVKNRVFSVQKTEDIVYGTIINFTDSVLDLEVLALLDGGML